MITLKLRSLYASPTRTVQAGEIADFDDAEAQALLDGGYAELLGIPADDSDSAADTDIETATAPDGQVEKAILKRGKPRAAKPPADE